MKLPKKWSFLTAPRFWSMMIAAFAAYLYTDGFISAGLAQFLYTFAGGFTVIGTVDRAVDKFSQ